MTAFAHPCRFVLLTACGLLACTLSDVPIGAVEGTSDGADAEASGSSAPINDPGTAEAGTGDDDPCTPSACVQDVDRDGVAIACDNDPGSYNPDQLDSDQDGEPDVIDLCPLIESSPTADSDRDGIGNECDVCPSGPGIYNEGAIGVPANMLVRNVPDPSDADGDGVGDACDNCPTVPNCEGYDETTPWGLGDPIDRSDAVACQADADGDMIGNACEGLIGEQATAPVGLGSADDFDQDGLANAYDGCPRQPLAEHIECESDSGCPLNQAGAAPVQRCVIPQGATIGVCNHADYDRDDVGDICDTCPSAPNDEQVLEGSSVTDDPDGDFVGAQCEAGEACNDYRNAARIGFYPSSSNGLCCATQLVEGDDGSLARVDGPSILAPDGIEVRVSCTDEQIEANVCRRLPAAVADTPGLLVPPPGCGEVSIEDNQPLNLDDFDGDIDALWAKACRLPPVDFDLDGLAHACDFCPFAFDPDNLIYVDDNGMVWEHAGRYCSGEYDPENTCFE